MHFSVLFIEDSNADFEYYHDCLTRGHELEFDISRVLTAQAALEWAGKNHYDCIVLDNVLPDGTGVELLKRLRRMDSEETPIIFVTAYGDEETEEYARLYGATDYLSKNDINPTSFYHSVMLASAPKILHHPEAHHFAAA